MWSEMRIRHLLGSRQQVKSVKYKQGKGKAISIHGFQFEDQAGVLRMWMTKQSRRIANVEDQEKQAYCECGRPRKAGVL